MQRILPQNSKVAVLTGVQKAVADSSWRMTAHSVFVPCEQGILLYHSMTGELLLLSKDEREAISSDPILREELAEKWFLVPNEFSEKQFTDEIREALKFMKSPSKDVTVFTIFPTTDCNARCFYCYEKGRSRLMMSDETAHQAAAYIIRVSGGKKIWLRWFGGEPLYNKSAINIITGDLLKAGICFTSEMISNGLLFDRETVQKAKKLWKLESVQITLDGTEQVYNRIKAYVNTEGNPYRQIMENIGRILDEGIILDIRLNMDRRNADDLNMLVDELAERFGTYPNFRVYCALLRDWGARNAFSNEEEAIRQHSDLQAKLVRYGIERKYTLSDPVLVSNCIADNDEAVMILPDGHLGKCEHYSDEGYIGSLSEGINDEEWVKAFKIRRADIPECGRCRHYPRCLSPRLCADISEGCTPLRRHLADTVMESRIRSSYSEYLQKQQAEQ